MEAALKAAVSNAGAITPCIWFMFETSVRQGGQRRNYNEKELE